MSLKRTVKLTLFEIEEVNFPDKETGQQVKKFKYLFFDEEGTVHVGYLDTKVWKDRLCDTHKYIDSKSHDYDWLGREWQGVISWKLASELKTDENPA